MRARADPPGPDETDAGAGHGPARMHRSPAGVLRDIQTIPGVRRVRCGSAAPGLWECSLAGSEGSSGQTRVPWRVHGRFQGECRRDLSGADLRVYRIVYL